MFSIFGFGKKRSKKGSKKGSKKPNARIVRMARKYKVKITKKVGKRRVYKSISLIRRQIKKKMRKNRKSNKSSKSGKSGKRYIIGGRRGKCCELWPNGTKKYRCICRRRI